MIDLTFKIILSVAILDRGKIISQDKDFWSTYNIKYLPRPFSIYSKQINGYIPAVKKLIGKFLNLDTSLRQKSTLGTV